MDETSPGKYKMDMLEIVCVRLVQFSYSYQVAEKYDIFGLAIILKRA